MAKIKIKPNTSKRIQIIIFLMRGQETLDSTKETFETNQQIIDYREIQQKCGEFLQSKNTTYEINIYAPSLNNVEQLIKLEPNHSFVIEELIQKMNGTLILIIKSVYQELREDFQAQIDQLKQSFSELKQMLEQLKPIKDNIEFLRKTSTTGVPLMLPAQSMMQKDYQHLQLDIAVLFSEPLYDDEKKKPTPPAVDFRSQISRLNIALQSSFKSSVFMRCQIATVQSLKNVIKYSKPKIIHIVCHGNSEGFLQFQDDSRNTLGVLQLIKPDDIKNSLKNLIQLLPQLVFVNSCHSENIGKAFFDIGVKNVIGINSQDLIIDEAAQMFSQNFYRHIFRGQNVMQAFLLAKRRVQLQHVGGCCCYHGASQPHRQNCRWLKLQKRYPTAHKDYHVPSAKCECQLRNFNRHAATCQWARKVLFQINQDFRIPVQEGSTQYRFPCHISEFPEYFDRQKRELVICCCPVKGRKPHSESNKFLIMAKDEGKQPLFHIIHNRVKPQITDLTPVQLLQAHEKSKAIFGRQRQLFQFLKIIKQINFMVVYGKTGTGLTNFTVKASTYMMERRIFNFFFFIDLYDIKDQIVFRYKFNEITKFQYNGKTIDQIGMKNKKILILLDNCDDFINASSNQFYKQIQTILRQMPKCKIIITFKEQTNKIFDQKKVLCRKFQLSPFQIRYAISFLNSRLKDKTDISVGYQQFRKLINQYPVLKIPKVIESLSQSFSDSTKKIKYQQIENNVKGIQVSDTNKLTEQVLIQLKEKSLQAYEFLIFVSQFSDGVSFEDLNMFSLYADKELTVQLPVRRNWQDYYLMLFEKQIQKKLQAEYPKLVTTVSHAENPSVFYENEKPNIQMKKKVSEAATSSDNNNPINQLDEIKSQSYFIDKNGKGKFIVKRFIRDFVWNKYENQTTFQMKFIYVAYFSVILQMLFRILLQEKYIHEDLMTYSAVSKSGIFSFATTLQNNYSKQDLTKSVRLAKTFISDLDNMFAKNPQLIEKMKNTDPSTFIMNHQHDFLKVYDYKWSDVFNYYKARNKSQQKIFLILLQNLLVYIPTALKIAKAEDSLLRYVLRGSIKQLVKIRVVSRPDRCLKNQLKVIFTQIGINLDDKQQLADSFAKANDTISLFKSKIGQTQEYADIQSIFQEQILTIQLLTDLSTIKSLNANDIYHLKNRIKQFQRGNKNFQLDPLIKTKQVLLLSLTFLKFLKKNQAQKKIILKSQDGQQLKNRIYQLCESASQTFEALSCVKLKLKTDLTSLQLFWDLNERFQSNSESNTQIDKCLQKIIECEKMYLNNENRLRGFTEFDNKIKQLKQQIKGKLWKSAAKRIIFMKAFPLATKQNYPIIKNLVRKKNNFRKQIQKIFKQPKYQNLVSERKISGIGSPALKSKDVRSTSSQRKMNLDISTKFEVLTEQKIQEEARARCSIMYLTVDVKQQNQKVYFVCENQLMGEQLVEIDENLAEAFNFQNILILIMAGVNTIKALNQISKLSPRPPILIALNSNQIQHHDEIDYSHDFDSDSIRELIRKQNEIKQTELIYTKNFINSIITQSEIQSSNAIQQIHKKAEQKMKNLGSKRVKAVIELNSCSKQIYLKYNQGVYRDLSPGYERNHNIDQKYYENNVLVRRWRKMLQFFKFIHGSKIRMINNSEEPDQNTDIFQSIFTDDAGWKQNQTTSYINIYGDNGCGKTSFIRQIAKILVQRQFYDYGVFLFQGKKIQNHFNGDFEAYIKKQASLSRMPNLQDFHRQLGQKTILIVDDFHMIKPRVNARMKIFMDKILSKKVNLILVSINELKLQFLPKMKKIKLQPLDSFQTQILAYNILNISNPEQLNAFNRLKQNSRKKNKAIQIKDIDECKRARVNQLQIEDIDGIEQGEMKKSLTTVG